MGIKRPPATGARPGPGSPAGTSPQASAQAGAGVSAAARSQSGTIGHVIGPARAARTMPGTGQSSAASTGRNASTGSTAHSHNGTTGHATAPALAASAGAGIGPGIAERLARRDQLIVLLAAGFIVALATAYTVLGVGMNMSAVEMTRVAAAPEAALPSAATPSATLPPSTLPPSAPASSAMPSSPPPPAAMPPAAMPSAAMPSSAMPSSPPPPAAMPSLETPSAAIPPPATSPSARPPSSPSASLPAASATSPSAAPGLGPTPAPMPMSSATLWTPGYGALVVLMWWVMMIAMMTPSAAPALLLFTALKRQGAEQNKAPGLALLFLAGYLLIWALFSLAATALQWGLGQAGLVAPMRMKISSAGLAGTVLILAGLYQFSNLKTACLDHCRSPAQFLTRHRRPGARGALLMGAHHGSFCLGCCWALMALLFVGGIMNLYWIAGLALYVIAEKTLPHSALIPRLTGAALILAGLAMLLT
jgi:predicted metal-binding membrane protein